MDLGRYGVWQSERRTGPELAAGLERAGYGTLWLGSAVPDLAAAEALLDATDTLVVATGIVNIWQATATEVAAAYGRVAARHPDRFLLGIGAGHREKDQGYAKPYESLAGYVDTLLDSGVPADRLVLAALGPKVLRLAADRTLGAHPYLVPVEHTGQARDEIGPGALLAPEQKVVLDTDVDRARATARATVETPYLHMVNYLTSLRRLGWTDADLAPPGGDALIDALVAHGTAADAAARIDAHLEAGADHVAVQLLGDGDLLAGYRELAPALGLISRDDG